KCLFLLVSLALAQAVDNISSVEVEEITLEEEIHLVSLSEARSDYLLDAPLGGFPEKTSDKGLLLLIITSQVNQFLNLTLVELVQNVKASGISLAHTSEFLEAPFSKLHEKTTN